MQHVGCEATLKAGAENIHIYAEGKMIAEHVRTYEQGKEVLKLSHYLSLLEKKPRSILQARPVRQALSPELMHLLQTTEFSTKELMAILGLCAEEGEASFWRQEELFLKRHLHKATIEDTVVVEAVDLSDYDRFLGRIRPIAAAAHPAGIHQAAGQLQLH